MGNDTARKFANQKLERVGLYERSIERWWSGFYHIWRGQETPDSIETLSLTKQEIHEIVRAGSRRG